MIEVADYRSIRGTTVCAALLDEVAFWEAEGVNPDREIVNAVRAGMASVPGAMLLIASSPYAKRGILWEHRRRHFGKENSRLLVWQAPTRTMNPTIPQSVIDEATAEDPEAAAAEFGAQFRSDVVSYVDRAIVEDAVIADRREVAPGDMPGLVNLVVHFDAAGGAGRDSFTMAIAGKDPETGKVILLCVREVKPPFSPESIVAEYATVTRSYGLLDGQSDKFAGSWPKEQFEKHGITLYPSKTSSEIFINALPLLMSGKVELLDNATLVNQLAGLERRVGRGRDHIAASGTAHDDVALAVCGALTRAAKADEAFGAPMIFIADEPIAGAYEANLRRAGPYGLGMFGDGAPRDYHTGTSRWMREQQRGREEN